MRTYRRQDQLGELIGHELSDLMRSRMKDPRLGFASITGVELSSDLRHARVFVSVMGDDQEQRASMRALESANGFLRHELAQRLAVRHVPELEFRLDTSIERGVHVLNLIEQVNASAGDSVSGTAGSDRVSSSSGPPETEEAHGEGHDERTLGAE